MISTKLHPWTPRLLWLLIPSLIGGTAWWFIVAQVLHGRLGYSTAALPALLIFVIFGIFSGSLWLGALGLSAFMATWRSARMVLAFIAALPALLFFPLTLITIGTMLALAAMLWWGLERTADDAHSRLSVRPRYSVQAALPVVVMVVMAAVSLLYYQQLKGSTKSASELESRLTNQTVSVAERFLPLVYKQYEPDLTVDQLISAQFPTGEDLVNNLDFSNSNISEQLRQELEAKGIDPTSITVPDTTSRDALITAIDTQLQAQRQEGIDSIRKELADRFGIAVKSDQTVHELLVAVISKQFDQYVKQYVSFVPWLLALALFFLLRVFSGLFEILAGGIAWLLYRLYRSLHILIINHETVPAEHLNWVE